MPKKSIDKWQFGDFQTPDELAQKVVRALSCNHEIKPDTIIEPSCGKGAFIRASLVEFDNAHVLGSDINQGYIEQAKLSISQYSNFENATIRERDFFSTNWQSVIDEQDGHILILGNPPWVTSSELSILNSKNVPLKSNFQKRRGIEAITGSGNFDISEWMLLQYVQWLSNRSGTIAVLCKYSVARKVLRQINNSFQSQYASCIYLIDANHYFSAAVEACLLVLRSNTNDADCKIYESLNACSPMRSIGKRDGFVVSNSVAYEKWKHLLGKELRYIWRSGIKHDCSKVMELERVSDRFENGYKNKYALEEDYLFPLLKSSDVGNGRVQAYRKLALLTQTSVGQDTGIIKEKAPRTWCYLKEHASYLDNRKSSIYKNKPPYSIFGVGFYTFKPWKIAISGLYKKLNFQLVGPLDRKAAVFDDTVNFLSFDTEKEARFVAGLITSSPVLELLESMIFWDEKRPITINILRRISLKAVAQELDVLNEYLSWATLVQAGSNGQFELGLAEKQAHYKV